MFRSDLSINDNYISIVLLSEIPTSVTLATATTTTATNSKQTLSIGCLFTGLDHWTGLLDWTTGLTFDLKNLLVEHI